MSVITKYKLEETSDGYNRAYQTLKEARASQQKNGGKIYKHIKKQIWMEVLQ